ncbi:hypothetical protein Vafri_19137 [Volvox africanus]|uniref:ubiquitinyl hydrolase 1 n=1 Tax=Volvox africanus TaxID=51714 RepID=A0A8J4BNC7_9CHLO|nr:hypothetical protein Vafri_19137 [Volvox africanus]
MASFSRRDPVRPEGATHLNCYGYAEPIFLCLSHMPEVAEICLKSDHCTACEGISCNSHRSVQIGGPPFKCVMCTMKGQMIRHLSSCDRKLEKSLEGIPTSFTTERVHLAATGNDHRVFMEEVLSGAAEDEKAIAPKGSVTLMDKLFNGVWHCRTTCRGCGYVWDEPMPFKLLSLDIEKATTLQEAFSENFGMCDLSRAKDRCERCQGSLVEECAITMAPDALIIKLERLEARHKDLRHLEFDFDLDLAPYMAQDVSIPGGPRYQLTGIIEHRQEYLSTSYYTACVRGQKGEWRAMNNTLLHEVAVEEVRRRQPYILFYSRGGAKLPSQADVLEAPMVPPGNKEATTPSAAIDAQLPKTPPRRSIESPMPTTLPPKAPRRVQRQLQLTPSNPGCAPSSPQQPTVVEIAAKTTQQPALATPPLPHQPSTMKVPPPQQPIDVMLLKPQGVTEAPILTPPRLRVPLRAELQSGLFPPSPKTPSTQQPTVAKGSQQTKTTMQQPVVVTLPQGPNTQKRSRDEERAGDGKSQRQDPPAAAPQTPPTQRSRRCTKSLEPCAGSRKRKSNALDDGSGDTFVADTGFFHRLAKFAKTMARRLTGSRDGSGSGNSSASTAINSTRSTSAAAIASSTMPSLPATENFRPMKEIIADLRRIRAECSHGSARGVSSAF